MDFDRHFLLIETKCSLFDGYHHLKTGQQEAPVLVSKLNATEIIVLLTSYSEEHAKNQVSRVMKSVTPIFQHFQISEYYTVVGRICPGIEGLKKSINEVKDSLHLLERMKFKRGLYTIDELNLEALLVNVVENKLDTLTGDQRIQHFLQMDTIFHTTLVTLCECNLNVSVAARNLHIHRNTLLYRINKIQEVTSLDISEFSSAVLLYLTLKIQLVKQLSF